MKEDPDRIAVIGPTATTVGQLMAETGWSYAETAQYAAVPMHGLSDDQIAEAVAAADAAKKGETSE
jgi:hypothetical protein